MIAISQVIQHLTQFDANRSIAQTTFVNFLKNATEPNEVFTASTLELFYRRTLAFPYWQTHQESLGEHVRSALAPFGAALGFDLSQVSHAEDYQVVPVRKSDEFFEILRNHDKLTQHPSQKIQYIELNKRKYLRLDMSDRGEVTAHVVPHIVFLQRGRLQPLTESSLLRYDSNLELAQNEEQWVELGESRFARFFLRQGKIYGSILRGHMFSQETALAGPISKFLDLCIAIKTIERYFVDPISDPMYQQVANFLEMALKMNLDTPQTLTEGEIALKESKEVLQLFFPHDKLLHHLVYKLESHLRNAKGLPSWPQNPRSSASTSSSLNLGSQVDVEPINLSGPAKF